MIFKLLLILLPFNRINSSIYSDYEPERQCRYCLYVSYAENYKLGLAIHEGHSHKCKKCRRINAYGFSECVCQ